MCGLRYFINLLERNVHGLSIHSCVWLCRYTYPCLKLPWNTQHKDGYLMCPSKEQHTYLPHRRYFQPRFPLLASEWYCLSGADICFGAREQINFSSSKLANCLSLFLSLSPSALSPCPPISFIYH